MNVCIQCGGEFSVKPYLRERAKFCGYACYHENQRQMGHGMTGTPEFRAWRSMRERCQKPQNKAYKDYGGRGISVCDRWNNSFLAFYYDLGPRPSSKHSLGRIDNDGNYEPRNCRWETTKQQAINKRSTKLDINKARRIRALACQNQSYREIARQFSVSPSLVSLVARGKIWAEF